MLSEQMVRHVIGTRGARTLIEITRGAWEDFMREGRPRAHRSTQAAIVWDYMVLRADAEFEQWDGVAREIRMDRPLYVLRDLIVMRPKKHDRNALTRNYPTQAQLKLRSTGYFDELDIPNITFGYMLDRAEAGIEQCLITSPADEWIIDLADLASGNLAPTNAMFSMPDLDEAWRRVDSIRPVKRG